MEQFESELRNLQNGGLYRSLNVLSPLPETSTRVQWNGQKYTLFCSNDYLGLSRHPRLIKAVKDTVKKYGVGTGASRLISGTTDWHEKLERKLASFKKKESALVFSSGFLANLGIITSLTDKNSLIIIDKRNHASIIDACRLSQATLRVYPHKRLEKLETLLRKSKEYNRTLIITDSVFSMDGDLAPLSEIVRLKEKYGALLMIDEAHATGVFGPRGSGLAEELELEEKIDIIMGTLSKAIGSLGGYVAASRAIIDYVKNKGRPFIYTTSLPAILCAASFEAIQIIEEEWPLREQLWNTTHLVKKSIAAMGFDVGESVSPIIPIVVGEANRAVKMAQYLFDQKIYVPAVRPPTVPSGSARLRITVSAAHTETEVKQLLSVLEKFKNG
ncbi:MAG: 8-amino-7-oxononanoate synthase [Candidatus Omnitrophica bacterium]|nr:8-amino-7-oxononanoate synthase [Candidatus Omnitrophota bacterium]